MGKQHKKSNIALFLSPKLKSRFGLLQQTRKFDDAQAPLFIQLVGIEETLKRHYAEVKMLKTGSAIELEILKEIKSLEDKRFLLLDQINGQKIDGYAI